MRLPNKLFGLFVVLVFLLGINEIAHAQNGEGAENQPIHTKVFQGKVYCSSIYPVQSAFVGEVVEKNVKIGQRVSKGDVLLKIALLKKDVYALTKRLDRELPILNAQLSITTLNRELQQREKQKRDTAQLIKEGMASQQAGQDIENEIDFLKLKIKHANKELSTIRSELKKEVAFVGDLLGQKIKKDTPKYALVLAPTDGFIVWERVNIRVGALVAGKVFEIGVMNPMVIRTQMYESDSSQIKSGDVAEVILEFGPEEVLQAVVKSISWLPIKRDLASPTYYMVDLEISNPANSLKEGYKVRVMFPEVRKNILQ